MAVALDDLVPTLRRAVNPPGQQIITAGRSEWIGRLADAFWQARLNDFFVGFTYDDDAQTVIPIEVGADDLPRQHVQLIVDIAALNALEQRLLNLPTASRAKAGPVETETQRSANLLVELLKNLTARLGQSKAVLMEASTSTPRASVFFDSLVVAANRFAYIDEQPYGYVR